MKYREATKNDINAIFHVRTSVRENKLTLQQLQELGITPKSINTMLKTTCKAWVAEHDHDIIGFSMANKKEGRVYALFILPEWENKGIGKNLLNYAESWLWQNGFEEIWLTTESGQTRAGGFYKYLGWRFKEKYYDDEDILFKSKF